MALDLLDAADLALLLAGYWLLDRLTRRDGLLDGLRAVGIRSFRLRIGLWSLVCAALAPLWSWAMLPEHDAVRLLAAGLTAMLSWRATTEDIDPVFGDQLRGYRLLLIAAAVLAWFSPAGLLLAVVLLSTPFGVWEHHATLPMRVLQATVAWLALAALANPLAPTTGLFVDATALVFLVLTIQISHYLITALAKIWLGPKWYSWVVDNRVHHLAATSWSWGWARFVPWSSWRHVIATTRRVERPMQAFAFAVELLAPFALLHPLAGFAFCLGWAGFHAGVFALSGLLFWDWILTDLLVALTILWLPASVTTQAFGWLPLLVSLAVLVAFPLRHKLWKPIPLGWWDTPFTQRMHWRVVGASGAIYGLYNDFMCPHERLYGKVHASFLAPRRGITYHLGEVWKRELRDAIRDAGPDLARLDTVRDRYGVEIRDQELADNHVAYLKRFFHALNSGARKHVLPRWLRWLKAPGDQVFYWGELPRYQGQEPVTQVQLHYREEYFDGEQLVRLCDEPVLDFAIDAACATIPCRPEPTPREIDDLLLRHANGKIIDLPSFGSGYVDCDDGKAGARQATSS